MENLTINLSVGRAEKYATLLPQIESLIAGENDFIANLANGAAALRQTFGFFWVGFYIVKGKELVLGPFQGDIACTRIGFGKGVCGTAWQQNKSQLVPDVDSFPGHIACSSLSRSEVVIPGGLNGEVMLVLDVDSEHLNDFTQIDIDALEQLMAMLEKFVLPLHNNTAL